MTPKMTLKVTVKVTPKRQRMTPRMVKNDTKNGIFTDDLQEVNNGAINTRDAKNDTKKKNELSVIEADL